MREKIRLRIPLKRLCSSGLFRETIFFSFLHSNNYNHIVDDGKHTHILKVYVTCMKMKKILFLKSIILTCDLDCTPWWKCVVIEILMYDCFY